MRILGAKLGFTTNSSSQHGIVFRSSEKDRNILDADGRCAFGRDEFVISSEYYKRKYAGLLIREALAKIMPAVDALIIAQSWAGVDLTKGDYIDHQSVYAIPREYGTNFPSRAFFDALLKYYTHPELVIHGYDDNQPRTWPGESSIDIPDNDFVCRYDEVHGYWTLFNQEDGTLLRVRLVPGEPYEELDYDVPASVPESVDLKITDRCPYMCSFCYQGSSINGTHAKSWVISDILHDLAKAKVFEVAIGGGEPTMHDDLLYILEQARELGIVPNITTRNYKMPHWDKVMDLCGAVGFSVLQLEDVEELNEIAGKHDTPRTKVNLHVIAGTVPPHRILDFVHYARKYAFSLTLLGYKAKGRANAYPPHRFDAEDFRAVLRYACDKGVDFGIDTAIAAEYHEVLKSENISRLFYHLKEGTHSCYIDAVRGVMGPSSYCDDSLMVPYNSERFVEVYRSWQSTPRQED